MLRRIIMLISGAAIVVASFIGTTWLLDTYWGPPCPQGQSFLLKRPFNGWGGFAYTAATATVPGPPDDSDAPTRSKYALCEDDTLLGPAHSDHGSIAKVGGGRFSHWTSGLLFSTSDNSNPNTNGRAYRLVE